MQAGLLFCQARRTGVCQDSLYRYSQAFALSQGPVKIAPRPGDLCPALSSLLRECELVYVISGCENGQPLCVAPVFQALQVPLLPNGEPRGVLPLDGVECRGYLVESETQAIALLTDIPYEIDAMLAQARRRLEEKFCLSYREPERTVPDFEALAEAAPLP